MCYMQRGNKEFRGSDRAQVLTHLSHRMRKEMDTGKTQLSPMPKETVEVIHLSLNLEQKFENVK